MSGLILPSLILTGLKCSLHFFGQAASDDLIGLMYPVGHFLCAFAFKRDADPGPVEVFRLLCGAHFNQELGGFDVRAFDGHAVGCHANAGKHFAADFPRIQPAIMVTGPMRAGQGGTDFINIFSCHCLRVPWCA